MDSLIWTLVFAALAGWGVAGWLWWRHRRRVRAQLAQAASPELSSRRGRPAHPWPEVNDYALTALQAPEITREADRAALAEVDAFVDLLEQRLREGAYLPAKGIGGERGIAWSAVYDDLKHYLRAIARHYHPHLDDPLLATRPIDIAHVIHRSSMVLLGSVPRAPWGLAEMSIDELVAWFRRARDVLARYNNLKGIWDKYRVGLAWNTYRVTQMVLAPTPAGLALLVGSEVARRLINRYGPDVVFAVMIRHRLQMIARTVGHEAMRTFGGAPQFSDISWLQGCELAEMFRTLPAGPSLTRALLNELGCLKFPTSYERIAVLGFVTDATGLDTWLARNARTATTLPDKERDEVARLCQSYLNRFHDPGGQAMRDYIEGFRHRWSRNLTPPTSESAVVWRECVDSWVVFLRLLHPRADRETLALELAAVARAVGKSLPEPPERLLEFEPANVPFVPVAIDPEDSLGRSYLDGLVEITVRHPSRAAALDDRLAEVERFYRSQGGVSAGLQKRWEQIFQHVARQAATVDDVMPPLRRRLLAELEENEPLICLHQALDEHGKPTLALALTRERMLLLEPDNVTTLNPVDCTLLANSGYISDELRIAWPGAGVMTCQCTVESRAMSNRELRYAALVRELVRRGARDHTGWGLARDGVQASKASGPSAT